MYYRDLPEDEDEAREAIASYFECSLLCAEYIRERAKRMHERGSEGEHPFTTDCGTDRDDFADHVEGQHHLYGGLDKHEVGDFLRDAWIDGITAKDRVTVHLDTDTDGCCTACGACVASDDEECDDCGSTEIDRMVMVTVDDPFSDEWADHDQSIDGSSWETPSDMPHFAYTVISDRPGLVKELRAEGYRLDLSSYDGISDDPESEANTA